MVHPPAVPDGRLALEWLPRVQLAAARVVAHLDDGWEDSVRKLALDSVLLGPRDWTTVAAGAKRVGGSTVAFWSSRVLISGA